MTRTLTDLDECVEATLASVGRRLVIGLPVGIGKPNLLINAFVARALREPQLELTILSGLSLRVPRWRNDLERRFLQPFVQRVYGAYPELEYARLLERRELPRNIQVVEFFLEPGASLDNDRVQQNYLSANYTHVVRDALQRGLNVLAQLVAIPPAGEASAERLSLSCNPDLALDLLPHIAALRAGGQPFALIGQTHRELPFMYGDAVVPRDTFDLLIDDRRHDYPLFVAPNLPLSTVDYLIALGAGALIKDGGTLQIGIGELGDAIVYGLKLRHEQPAIFRQILDDTGILARHAELIAAEGGTEFFARGLYGCSEMLVDGFLDLYRAGILKRRVVANARVQQSLDRGETCDEAAELLRDGVLLDAGFFIGPRSFYSALRELPAAERRLFAMRGISFVNELSGPHAELKIAQRRHARFINTTMCVTGLGAAVSDSLADGRVVSGVGGQYNFVAMAHALPEARSILCLRSTRTSRGKTTSNIVWEHAQATIPRHLRDIVVTEYGVAELRGRTDAEVAGALVSVMDARFQDEFVAAARSARKLPADFRVPTHARGNLPERLERELAPFRKRGLFAELPFGSDFDAHERVLAKALRKLAARTATRSGRVRAMLEATFSRASEPELLPYLERMALDRPASLGERLKQRLVAAAVRSELAH